MCLGVSEKKREGKSLSGPQQTSRRLGPGALVHDDGAGMRDTNTTTASPARDIALHGEMTARARHARAASAI